MFQVLKGENLQLELFYSARISLKIDGEIKSFTDKQRLREFSTIKPVLQKMLKGLYIDRKYKRRKRLRITNPK